MFTYKIEWRACMRMCVFIFYHFVQTFSVITHSCVFDESVVLISCDAREYSACPSGNLFAFNYFVLIAFCVIYVVGTKYHLQL